MINGFFGIFKKNGLFSSAFIYTFANIANSAIPFFLMPILTRILTPEDYGYTAMFGVLSSISAALVGLSVHGSLARQFYDRESVNFSDYVGACLSLLGITALVVIIVLFPFADLISKWSSFPISWLVTVVLSSFLQFIILLRLTIWQLERKALSYGLLNVSVTAATLISTLVLVKEFHFNWQGRVIGLLGAQIIAALYSLVSLRNDNYFKPNLNKDYLRRALYFGVPLIPHSIGGMIIVMTDRVLLTNMVGLSETGLYSVGAQIGMIVGILTDSFNKAYAPWLFEKLKNNLVEDKVKIVRGTYIYFIVILIFVGIFSHIAPWFFSLFLGPKFNEASKFIFWLALGGAFTGMYYMVTNYIFYAHKTKYLALVTFTAGLLNVGMSYFLIKRNGAVGAAQGTAVSLFISFILTWILSMRVYSMPWFDFNRILIIKTTKNKSD